MNEINEVDYKYVERKLEEAEKEVKRLKQESKDWETKYYDLRKGFDSEVSRLKCMLELSTNLKQQAEAEIEILKKEIKQLKEFRKDANKI